jgi:hypothetical protein
MILTFMVLFWRLNQYCHAAYWQHKGFNRPDNMTWAALINLDMGVKTAVDKIQACALINVWTFKLQQC